MTSTQESGKRFLYRQIPWLTSLQSTLTAKKSMKMKSSADKIYYNFSQENSKSTNIQNPHRPYRRFKVAPDNYFVLVLLWSSNSKWDFEHYLCLFSVSIAFNMVIIPIRSTRTLKPVTYRFFYISIQHVCRLGNLQSLSNFNQNL